MKTLVVALAALLLVAQEAHSLNEKQMVAAAKLIRNTCKSKIKVTDEVIDNMHKGIWDDDDDKAKCYYHCCLAMMKMQQKSGAFDLESALKQLPSLPEARRPACEVSMRNCEHAGDDKTHKCDIAYSWFKCMYFDNTDNFFFP